MTHPKQLGKYPITGVLGKGAMGVVYKGFDPVINRPVAIKTILKSLIDQDLSGSSGTARFRNEARAVGRLSHPGIVPIYEYGEDETTAYIAMEYVEGRNLSQILASAPRPPEADMRTLMDQLLAALDCAHRAGVWHRDIKPANLIVTHAGQLKVTDFGIARIENLALTQMTSSIGTPGYMAPEQYTGEGLDHRVDIYAAGVLLYCLLTGQPPFAGNAEVLMHKVLNEMPPPPSSLVIASWVRSYDAIVSRAMAKQAQDRFASAAEFREALASRAISQPVNDEDAATIIVIRPEEVTPSIPAADLPGFGASGSPSQPGSGPISGWGAETLLQVEAALAYFVGPVAKVLVRRAARTCADLPSLTSSVAAQLPSDADRARFLARLGGRAGSSPGTPAPPGAPVSGLGSRGTRTDQPLSPGVIAASQKVLTRHLGPIASVVIRRSAAKAADEDEFFRLLVEQADGVDRERLLDELRRGA